MATFEERYAKGTEGFAILAQTNPDDEGGFSRSACDTCGCKLGGYRWDAILCNPGPKDRETVDVRVCADCLAYAANGTLPTEDQGNA